VRGEECYYCGFASLRMNEYECVGYLLTYLLREFLQGGREITRVCLVSALSLAACLALGC
jgi:hypothetical protein